jgi:hypothetical protein
LEAGGGSALNVRPPPIRLNQSLFATKPSSRYWTAYDGDEVTALALPRHFPIAKLSLYAMTVAGEPLLTLGRIGITAFEAGISLGDRKPVIS